MNKIRTMCVLVALMIGLMVMASCQKAAENEEAIPAEDSLSAVDTAAAAAPDTTYGQIVSLVPDKGANQYYTVVFDDVRLREKPALDGKIVGTVNHGARLKVVNEDANFSENTDTVVLRGVRYTSHWYYLEGPDGKMVWIFGAAIGRYQSAERV